MRWLVNVEGDRQDIERLLAQPVEGLAATAEPHMALLEIVDHDHADKSDEALAAGRTLIDAPRVISTDSASCAGGGHSLA